MRSPKELKNRAVGLINAARILAVSFAVLFVLLLICGDELLTVAMLPDFGQSSQPFAVTLLDFILPTVTPVADSEKTTPDIETVSINHAVVKPVPIERAEEPEPLQNETLTASQLYTAETVDTTITGDTGGYDNVSSGIYIKNRTGYTIDIDALLSEQLDFSNAKVLIIHTHGSEAYTPDGDDDYEPTDPYRTVDDNYNVIRVGDELERILTENGIPVIHNRELYDYPSYNGSYSRAMEAIQAVLAENPDVNVVIDLHRDALEDDSGNVYKTVADIGDTPCAQIMIVAGTDYSGLYHPQWQKNLAFALQLQLEMNSRYPTLARPISISEYRYNQSATTGSLIVEVGTNGNTLEEALTAVRYFGDCLTNVISPADTYQ